MPINACLKQIHIGGCDQTDIITGAPSLVLGPGPGHWTHRVDIWPQLPSHSQMGGGKWIVSTLRPDQPPPHYRTQRVLTDFRPTN